MRKAFAGLATLLVVVVVAQFSFAATGAFSTAPREESFRPHHALGYVIFLLPIVMAIFAAAGRLPGRLIGLSALIAGLAAVQVLIAEGARSVGDTGGDYVFGLHAVNGLAILAVAGTIARRAWALSTAPAVP